MQLGWFSLSLSLSSPQKVGEHFDRKQVQRKRGAKQNTNDAAKPTSKPTPGKSGVARQAQTPRSAGKKKKVASHSAPKKSASFVAQRQSQPHVQSAKTRLSGFDARKTAPSPLGRHSVNSNSTGPPAAARKTLGLSNT